jgi:NADPH:quinone reductase-like Zn-dependent oxidoreductase
MKAVIYTQYGSPAVLRLREIPKPFPGDHEVLVKVHAASINSWDWDLLTGRPYLFRLIFGLLKPRNSMLGFDVAGRVESAGKTVTKFKAGDAVFGDLSGVGQGSFAEYVCAPEKAFIIKPAGMPFHVAAAIPQAAVLAWQGLNDRRPVRKGDKILINGAGGGVGTFALQMAKSAGAEVTCVDKKEKLDMLQSMGADSVIDYEFEDFTRNGLRYDLILDVTGHHSVFTYKRSLLPGGIFALVGGTPSAIMQAAFLGPLISMSGKKLGILVHYPNKDLHAIIELIEKGEVKPVIDRIYPLDELPDALRYFGEGYVKGKIVITME